MNKRSVFITLIMTPFLGMLFWNLRPEKSPVEQVREQYLLNLEEFLASIGEFREHVKALDNDGENLAEIRGPFAEMRLAFKRWIICNLRM